MTRKILGVVLVGTLSMLLFGCSDKKEKGTSGKANLSLANATAVALTDSLLPSYFGMKIKSVYISPDAVGATSGPAAYVWTNPDCAPSTSTTEVNDKTYSYLNNTNCNINDVKTFFDLSRTTDVVNADLNSQNLEILPGSYNYVHIEICSGDLTADTKNIEFQTADMPERKAIQIDGCTIHSDVAPAPIEVGDGEAITVSLAYDLTGAVSDGADNDDKCYTSADGTIKRCGGWPTSLKPTFAKQ